MKESVIPKKLLDELEDVGKVYNSRSGMCVYPNAFSRLQTEIMKVCNEKVNLEKQVDKAKEIIKEYVKLALQDEENKDMIANIELFKKAEQFLKEQK